MSSVLSRLVSRLSAGAVMMAALGGLMAPRDAEAKFTFPYNHPDLDWYSIESEHFVVHYPVSKKTVEEGNEHYLTAEWSARRASVVAEEMWLPMCSQFNYFLKEKVHIVMLNQSDSLEGFTIPTWDWIEISAMQDNGFRRMRGGMEWFSDVLVHEFAHVVSLKANAVLAEGTYGVELGGLYSDGIRDQDTGATISIGDNDSVFWTEGGAEYWSDNSGYNWWSSSRDTFLRTTVLEDRLLRYEEWHTRAGKSTWWMDGERYYQQGYSFGQYLRQRFGDRTYNKFGIENGKRGWNPSWESVIKEVTGIDAKTLYNDWVAYAKEQYGDRYAAVKAQGEVVGRELYNMSPADWEFSDVAGREKWLDEKWYDRDKAREKTGRYLLQARVSDDGTLIGHNTGSASVINAVDDSMFPAFTDRVGSDPGKAERKALLSTAVPADFASGWDFVGDKHQVVVAGPEHMMPSAFTDVTGMRLETDGYDWPQLWIFDLPIAEEDVDGRLVGTREPKLRFNKHPKLPKDSYRAIPNTLRAHDPSVSPDGSRVAYFEYTDGTLNLVTINLDGSDKQHLTDFKDGTWLQNMDWSPDGKQIVFTMFRNYQQNIYMINADGTGLAPLTWDAWEEQDPHWTKDGRLLFSADPEGIFNIYSMDLKSREIRQLTNVIGAAESPTLTAEGNLIYTNFTAYGWKIYGLASSDFLGRVVTDKFTTQIDHEEAKAALAYSEDMSSLAAKTVPYKFRARNLMAPVAFPFFRLENDSQTNFGMVAGADLLVQDYIEDNFFYFTASLGEDMLFRASYYYQGWYPTLIVGALHYQGKASPGYLLDADDDPSTTDDQTVYEVRNDQSYDLAYGAALYPFNERLTVGLQTSLWQYGFRSVTEPEYNPYMREAELSLFGSFSNAFRAAYAPNSFTGRTVDLTVTHAYADIVYQPYGGVAVDDGQFLDKYPYNKVELRWTENIRPPSFGGIPFLKAARDHNHVIQIDTLIGAVDRNVDLNDEFQAGGQHPYYFGTGTVRPNTQFAGYPQRALSGETIGILNLAYRFPISQYIAKKAGPFFVHGLYAQVAGTAGNLWSYRVADGAETTQSRFGEAVATDPNDIYREVPFVDTAYKNGNRLLFDASAELRVEGALFHVPGWNSFFRVAYGFNEVGGAGDVNGDGIYDTSENAIADSLSNEKEAPGPRFYLGLGTGW